MKSILSLLTFLIFSIAGLQAQEEQSEENSQKTPISDRINIGGTFWMSFSDQTFIDISPIVSYRVTDKLNLGAGFIYNYKKRNAPSLSYHDYGFRIISFYKIIDPVFAQAEFEHINYQSYNPDLVGFRRINNAVNLGGGVSQNVGKNIHLMIAVLYNVVYQESNYDNHPYQSPWVYRVGVSAGF